MTPEILKGAIDSIKSDLAKADNPGVRILLDAFMAQQLDLEGLALCYSGLIKASTELAFWANVLTGTIRPASKGRAFVSKESAEKLLASVKAFTAQDGANRLVEQPIDVVAEPILTETKPTTK